MDDDERQALRYVKGLEAPRAADVYAALAAGAIRGHDLPAARRYTEETAGLDPSQS